MPDRSSKRPHDANQLAKLMVDIASGDLPDPMLDDSGKNPAAVALGRMGGLKGGRARAVKLSATQKSDIARTAAAARWGTKGKID